MVNPCTISFLTYFIRLILNMSSPDLLFLILVICVPTSIISFGFKNTEAETGVFHVIFV